MIPLADPVPTGDALAAARELLPAWVVWGRTLVPPVFVVLVQVCAGAWIVALLSGSAGPASGLHWTERARRIANVKLPVLAIATVLIAPAILIPIALPSAFDLVPGGVIALVSIAALLLAAHLGRPRLQRALIGRESTWAMWARESSTSLLLFQPAMLAAVTGALLIGHHPTPPALACLLLLSGAIVWFSLGQGWRVLRSLGLARELDARPLIGDAAEGVRFFEIDLAMANAIVLQHARVVLVTRRARTILADKELAAVLHHELGHLAEPLKVMLLRSQVVVLLLALAWFRPLSGWLGTVYALLLLQLAWLATWAVGKKSKTWETRADAHAHEHVEDPSVYARALEKLHEENLAPAVTHREGTHPHLYDRMLAAGLEPGYRRPQSTRSFQPWGIGISVVVIAGTVLVENWTRPRHVPRAEHAVLRALALGGFTEAHLRTLAELREDRGLRADALCFRAAADELAPAQAAGSQR